MRDISLLLENRRAFLRYLERKTGDRALAEDILQDALTKVVAAPERLPGADEAIVPWFYRTLRNAAIDRFRRMAVMNRAVEAFARELDDRQQPGPDMSAEICACVMRLARSLKPEYAEALRAVDIEGLAVKEFAERLGVSSSNAGVRVFRARAALRRRVVQSCGICAEHGCVNCTCSGRPDVPYHPSAEV